MLQPLSPAKVTNVELTDAVPSVCVVASEAKSQWANAFVKQSNAVAVSPELADARSTVPQATCAAATFVAAAADAAEPESVATASATSANDPKNFQRGCMAKSSFPGTSFSGSHRYGYNTRFEKVAKS